MHPLLNQGLSEAHQQDLLESAARSRRALPLRRARRASAPAIRWQGLTLRLATSADGSAVTGAIAYAR